MRSRWIEHNGQKILFQDFSNLFYNSEALKAELAAVQEVVMNEADNSVLVLSDFTNTEMTRDVMPALNAASRATKIYVRKTAVLGVSGSKRVLGDVLSRITGQPLMYFADEFQAKDWLTRE